MSLTFVNQVGAVEGMNQAAPGAFLPESYVRWAQDILFDRVGEIRRRAPYETVRLLNEDSTNAGQPDLAGERVLGVVSTRNPLNENRFGIIVAGTSGTRVLFYDDKFRKTCFCNIESVRSDAIVFSRPSLEGGAFIGFLENYGAATSSNKNHLYYWRGGTGEGGYAVENATLGLDTATVNEITADWSDSNQEFTASSAHNLQAGYKLFVTNAGSAPTVWPVSTSTTGILTVDSQDLTATTFKVTQSAGANTDSNTVNLVVKGHVTHNNIISGAFDPTKITPGMFAFRVEGGIYDSNTNTIAGGTDHYLGVVKQAETTQVTLEKQIIRTFGKNTSPYERNTNQDIKFVNIRPYIHNHGRGLITKVAHPGFTVTSGSVGSEGEGHFASAGLADSPGWALYRASDGEWLGDVASVTNNAALSLDNIYHTVRTAMNADEYVARPYEPLYFSPTSPDPTKYTGCFNTTYAGYQWFGNGGAVGTQNRIVFSSDHDPESVDLSKDAADSIIIPGTQQMRGIATSSSGLLIFLEDKTYILRGNYRANFSLEELYPEGCLSAQSIVEYGGGVFWAAKSGILFYDGATVRNLTEVNLGSYYTDSIKSFDATSRRIYGFFYKDYLFMTFTGFASNYNPLRYEPRYASGFTSTPEIQGFPFDEWDPDFTNEDFKPINNVPVYWDSYRMYGSEGVSGQNTGGFWSQGVSLTNVTTTLGSDTITNISLPIITGLVDTATDTIILNNHGFVDDDPIVFTNVNDVTGLTVNVALYYVVNATQNDFQVAQAPADPPEALSSTGLNLNVDFVDMKPLELGNYIIGPGIPDGAVIGTVIDPTEITIEDDQGNPLNAASSTGLTATNKELTNNVATITVGSHAVIAGELITVNISDAVFDGTYVVKSVTSTTISYDKVNANVTSTATSGTVTWLKTIHVLAEAPTNNIWSLNNTFVWGPVNAIEAMTFAIYLPTTATSVITNFDFRGFVKLDGNGGTKGYAGINAINPEGFTGVYPRLIDVDSMLDPTGKHKQSEDSELAENLGKQSDLYYKGPDFYLQTKNYTVGDPVIRKWFRQVFLNLYQLDGGMRMDIIDLEDNDRVDVTKKRRRNWEVYEELVYTWRMLETLVLPKRLSPNRSTWLNVTALNTSWYNLADAAYERRKKKISWRSQSAGFRLYQMNKYRPSNYQTPQRPHTVKIDSWNIGFKPMRTSRA